MRQSCWYGIQISFKLTNHALTHISLASYFGDIGKQNSVAQDETPQSDASHPQGLNCLLTGISSKK